MVLFDEREKIPYVSDVPVRAVVLEVKREKRGLWDYFPLVWRKSGLELKIDEVKMIWGQKDESGQNPQVEHPEIGRYHVRAKDFVGIREKAVLQPGSLFFNAIYRNK